MQWRRGGVISSFDWFLPVFATRRGGGGSRHPVTPYCPPQPPPLVLRPLYYTVRPEDAPAPPTASERKLRKVRYTTHRQAGVGRSTHRVHIITRDEKGLAYLPTQLKRIHCNFTGDGKCKERGWACTPHPHQPGLILPSWWNVRQKAAFATLCTLWVNSSL